MTHSRKMRWGIILAMVVGSIGCVMFHPKLKIATWSVEGLNYTSPAALEKQVSILKGRHVVSLLFQKGLASTIKEELPTIATIQFIPKSGHEIKVKVVEKKAWVSFLTPQMHYFVAFDGTILNKFSSEYQEIQNLDQLMIIRNADNSWFSDLKVPSYLLQKTRKIINQINTYFKEDHLQIEFNKQYNITLIKNDVLPIKVGDLERLEHKFKNLLAFMTVYPLNNLAYIDISVQNKIIIKSI